MFFYLFITMCLNGSLCVGLFIGLLALILVGGSEDPSTGEPVIGDGLLGAGSFFLVALGGLFIGKEFGGGRG